MEETDPGIVDHLRNLARQGNVPSEMLRDLVHRLGPETTHKLTLVNYIRLAFFLTLRQASPIAGWAPDGSGELNDEQLDAFTMPEIARSRDKWDSLRPSGNLTA
jgi:hypothetical protein